MKFLTSFFLGFIIIGCSKTQYFYGEEYVYGTLISSKGIELNSDSTFFQSVTTPLRGDTVMFRDNVEGDYYWKNDTLILITYFSEADITDKHGANSENYSRPIIFSRFLLQKDTLILLSDSAVDSRYEIKIPEKLVKR